jgi:ribonuclease HI
MKLFIFTDGGSRGNPGNAAIGGVVFDDNKSVLYEFSKFIGTATNNEAEYSALLEILEWLVDGTNKFASDIDEVIIHLDSKLIVEQINKNWKIKEPRLREFALKCWIIIEKLPFSVRLTHVAREKNKEADLLVNQALDAYVG